MRKTPFRYIGMRDDEGNRTRYEAVSAEHEITDNQAAGPTDFLVGFC